MFKKSKVVSAVLTALGSALLSAPHGAWAQEAQRIEITGSAIKRIDAETAVPVTVVKMEDLKSQGITTVEEVMANLSAVQLQVTTNFSVGCTNCQGASFADLRGIGHNKTLILLNGRRLANNASDGSAPDLNMIPFAAIDRVEVLRDGASALYGTDAIGGVINFITRKDYVGGTVTAGGASPQHPGGKSWDVNLGFGYGDVGTQGFNLFGFLDSQKQNNISGSQRNFNSRIPGGLSGSTSPGNYFQTGAVVGNPSGPSCASGTFLIPNGDGSSCFMTTSKFVDYVPKSERNSGMLKGTLKLNDNHQLGLEYFLTQSTVETLIAPVPYGATHQNPIMPNGQPNPYYPGNSGNSFTPAFAPDPNYAGAKVGATVAPGGSLIQKGYMNVKWRDLPNGPRGDKNENTQQRFVASLEGTIGGWDYQAAATYNTSKVDQYLISGYNNGQVILEGILDGVINPFGAQSAAGSALIASALNVGLLQTSKATVQGLDGHASRDLGDWLNAGRSAALAVGAETRHEDFRSAANTSFATLVVASTGLDPTQLNVGTRDVYAGYAELNVPIIKSLDVTAAVRYDKYSDFGNTTNPKASFRFQPTQQVLVRGSYSTGFRAPTLYELHASQSYGNTGSENNPITCPGGVPVAGTTKVNNCLTQFQALTGGNLNLKPEKSTNATLGVVFEPMADTSVGIDFWSVKVKQSIGSVSETTLFGNYATFASYFHPLPGGALSTDGTQCPGAQCGYVDLRTQNLGGTNTNGFDLSASYKLRTGAYGDFGFLLNSTYVSEYKYQDYAGGPWNENVGIFMGQGPIFRWQHNLGLSWKGAALSAGLAVHFKSGYLDQNQANTVGSYTTADLYGTWQFNKALSLTLGVRNIADTAPPFTNQTLNFQGGGWDSRFTDPTGRAYYGRLTYNF